MKYPGLLIVGIIMVDDTSENTRYKIATFAGGCFWCMEKLFAKTEGVLKATSGYAGGTTSDPTYQFVYSGESDYVEATQIIYDPAVVNYKKLLEAFWSQVDPIDSGGQFSDRGPQYQTVIFYRYEQSWILITIRCQRAL